MTKTYKPTIKPFNEEKFYTNGQTFATKAEAEASAEARYNRWSQADDWGVEESTEPVNYKWIEGEGDVNIG